MKKKKGVFAMAKKLNLAVSGILIGAMTAGLGVTAFAEEQITLTYATWNENQRDSIQATIDGFEAEYPNIHVEIQITPWAEYWTKLEAAATSGEMPDIVTMHTNSVERYVNGGILAELEDLADYDESFSYDNYEAGITDLYTYNGIHYGVPKDKDCVVLVYNKKIFDDAGVEYPTADWTWDDLKEAAEKLTDKENGIYGFNAYNNDQEGYGSFLYANGADFLNEDGTASGLDTPEAIEAMEFYMELNANCSPSKEMQAEVDAVTMFATGTVAMQPIGNWQLSYFTDNETIKDDFALAVLPATPEGNRATVSNGLALSIPADCENMEAAKQFVAYASSEKGMQEAASGPAIPCYNGVDAVWAEEHADLYDTQVILDSLAYGKQLRGSEKKNQWGEVMYGYVGQIFDGTMSVEDAFTQASAEMNEILAQ
ncbi:MAG TPA: sugar ABC transporter substrate-binding protein [Candidatus Choladousia intestinavium]|uniref:Sugar ABC transporter substrate-binding protein n=1 Tax=Candidatus Choladousia intestinavium TaxID=2840727 RepID=A0A9D1ACS6_9FIRM|nr:sugar ABC transporter substrate-binding protein [Candidatus Choladousia intestinavium]